MENQSLQYTLLANHLKNDGRFMAKIINQKTIGFQNLLKEMEKETLLSKSDLTLAINQFTKAIQNNTTRGLKVETPLGTFRPAMKGSFAELDEDFRPFAETNNHELKLSFHPNKEFEQEIVKDIITERISGGKADHPEILRKKNISSPESTTFSSGDLVTISGSNLKVDAEMEDEGLFWVDSQGARVRTTIISHNTTSTMHFIIPQLDPGEYKIIIATRLGNHVLRTNLVEYPITIT